MFLTREVMLRRSESMVSFRFVGRVVMGRRLAVIDGDIEGECRSGIEDCLVARTSGVEVLRGMAELIGRRRSEAFFGVGIVSSPFCDCDRAEVEGVGLAGRLDVTLEVDEDSCLLPLGVTGLAGRSGMMRVCSSFSTESSSFASVATFSSLYSTYNQTYLVARP